MLSSLHDRYDVMLGEGSGRIHAECKQAKIKKSIFQMIINL